MVLKSREMSAASSLSVISDLVSRTSKMRFAAATPSCRVLFTLFNSFMGRIRKYNAARNEKKAPTVIPP